MRTKIHLLFLCLLASPASAQNILNPSDFLGYPLGSRFTFHHAIEDYCDYISGNQGSKFKKVIYGQSPEGRPLFVMIHSSLENQKKLDEIRTQHLINAGIKPGESKKELFPIAWLSYNVHGDEAAGSETALRLIFELAINKQETKQIIIIDPCLNPDGRERYVNWFSGIHHTNPTFDKNSAELNQEWPHGRFNHFYSDINRDWLWQVQSESQQRLKLYNSWMPHLHADFHEMEPEKSYFFPPAAEPIHKAITENQISNLDRIGQELGLLFQQNEWNFFNEEEFDLLYPSYADTYAIYNGAVGLTLEQAGSDQAGLLYIKKNSDSLKLEDRIVKHLEVSKTLLEYTSKNGTSLIEQFIAYHKESKENGNGKFKTYLIKGQNTAKTKALTEQLDRLGIVYRYASQNRLEEGFSFYEKKVVDFNIEANDLIVSTFQAKGHLVRVIFEPKTQMDNLKTYDISSWSLPYIHHLEAYALEKELKDLTKQNQQTLSKSKIIEGKGLAINWNSAATVKWLSSALKHKVSLFFNKEDDGYLYAPTEELSATLIQYLNTLALDYHFVDSKEWRKKQLLPIKSPRIGIIVGPKTKESSLGDLIVYLEKQIDYPYTKLWDTDFYKTKLNDYDIVIFANGKYNDLTLSNDNVKRWVANGGKLILLENATQITSIIGAGQLKAQNLNEIHYSKKKNHPDNLVQGAIFEINIHPSSLLKYGLNGKLNIMLTSLPKYIVKGSKGDFPSRLKKENYLAGHLGINAKSHLDDSYIFATYHFGFGKIIQMTFNPLFRGIWEDGKVLMGNALFLPEE